VLRLLRIVTAFMVGRSLTRAAAAADRVRAAGGRVEVLMAWVR
jgi:hypothetical protein